MSPNTLGSRIRLLRAESGQTAEEVYMDLGISRCHYYDLERGRRLPSVFVLGVIARYFRVSMDWLWFGEEEQHD